GEDHVWVIDVDGLAGVIGVRQTRDALPGPTTEVGYWVAPWARGRGLATAALTAVRDELAGAGYHRIGWATIAGNEASLRVARRAGFRIEGYRRQAMVQRGRLVDAVVGCWTAPAEVPELVAGQWQVQPAAMDEVPPDLKPLASCAIGVWMARSAVGGIDSGLVLAVRSQAGVHVVAPDAPEPAAAAVRRYLTAVGEQVTQQPLPPGWL
ncbi:MAG TPA: GNAT family protein, partial [Actinomycetota bacterium]|nr:GNAT family protein [Actinomycetota bacterium]